MNLMNGQLKVEETDDDIFRTEAQYLEESQTDFKNDDGTLVIESINEHSNLGVEQKMALNKKLRDKIFEESRELKTTIKPLEFESYEDYFVLTKFEKGVSVSGKVGFEDGKTRSTGVYYEKIKRGSRDENGENKNDSLSDSDGDQPKTASATKKRATRSQVSKLKRESSDSALPSGRRMDPTTAFFDTTISVSSIIPSENADGNIRRSSRLSQREREILENKANRLEENEPEEAAPEILDLFESIIPKMVEPVRRSDWLLPNKNRFIPEKFAPVKHTPEQIKINDLIHNSKIRKIMKRFKGGLAGVRKKDWEYVTEPQQAEKISG
ncbi:LANO_0H17194g1_1 [Lachancea nothofagi CBS 11611]|uniref:LANO_0H17194g1_1 n=1 Tax=Lachancea nothofagi CBS 11611 TaxID=1266666 RepID=A0A1G4KN13_9SACH|nr:LANO_0H17194g1_1 [Lachancea nothofagi CBS 11611]